MSNEIKESNEIILYTSAKGDVKIEVTFNDETFGLLKKK